MEKDCTEKEEKRQEPPNNNGNDEHQEKSSSFQSLMNKWKRIESSRWGLSVWFCLNKSETWADASMLSECNSKYRYSVLP